MQSYQSREMKRENLVPLKNQAKSFTTWLRVVHNSSMTYEMKMMKFQFLHKFRQRVSQLTCKCFATQTCPLKFALCILYILQVTHEWLVSHWLAKCTNWQFIKGSKCQFSKNLSFCSSQVFLPKSLKFLQNSTNLAWISFLGLL